MSEPSLYTAEISSICKVDYEVSRIMDNSSSSNFFETLYCHVWDVRQYSTTESNQHGFFFEKTTSICRDNAI